MDLSYMFGTVQRKVQHMREVQSRAVRRLHQVSVRQQHSLTQSLLANSHTRPEKVKSAPDASIIHSLEQKIGMLKISPEEAVA